MGFNSNSSDTAVVQESKLYTGLKNMKVVAINPSKSEMEDMGFRPKQDPVYITNGDTPEHKKLRLDFFLEGSVEGSERPITTKIAFFLENKHRTNKDGNKGEWINDVARSAWGSSETAPADYSWFDVTTARKCKIGESDLHIFLVNWLNIKPGDEAKLDNFDALFTGNYSELRQMLAASPNNEVRVLLTVRDGKYQSAYNRYFDRASNKRTTYWENHIRKQSEDGYPPKEDFSNSFTFQEWKEPSVMMDAAGGEEDTDTGVDPF